MIEANVNNIAIIDGELRLEYMVDYKHGYKTEECKTVKLKLPIDVCEDIEDLIESINDDKAGSLMFSMYDVIDAFEEWNPSAINRLQWNVEGFQNNFMTMEAENDTANRCCRFTFTPMNHKGSEFLEYWKEVKETATETTLECLTYAEKPCNTSGIKGSVCIKPVILTFNGFH